MRKLLVLLGFSVIALLYAGCVGDDPVSTAESDGGTRGGVGDDASSDGPSSNDATSADANDSGTPDAGPPCRLDLPFEMPTLLPGVNTTAPNASTLRARVSRDELRLYFTSDRDGSQAIYLATRKMLTDSFGSLTKLTELQDAWDPAVTDNELTIFFSSQRTTGGAKGGFDLWTASRANTTDPFASITNVSSLNSADDDSFPFVTGDGKELWFDSARGDHLTFRLYKATGGPAFTTAGPSMDLGQANGDFAPYLTSDGLTLYFASDRAGGAGSRDIWKAYRASPSDPFNAPTNVPGVNSSGDEHPGSLSPDGCRIYFDSNRSGHFAVYVAQRPTH